MENGGYLFAAYTLVWAAIFAYVLFLSAQQAKLRKEIDALKQGLKEKKTG
ncbi:MAG: CcmD family protein [Dehalococcoidales bacterium]|nr:CcmD family protein [Dehalococcoidales bacterium]